MTPKDSRAMQHPINGQMPPGRHDGTVRNAPDSKPLTRDAPAGNRQ